MALAGINRVEKFIYMILGVESEMRMNKEKMTCINEIIQGTDLAPGI